MNLSFNSAIVNKLKANAKPALFFVFLALSIHLYHRHTGYFNWKSELWGDQVGYYVYLPALFIYNFQADDFPEDINVKTGNGFKLVNDKVFTKYPVGVAILQLPFFLLIHGLVYLLGGIPDGFSGLYHNVGNIAALFYSFTGFLILKKFLDNFYNGRIVNYTLLTVLFGTNVFFYIVDFTGMSHVYSFFLFSAFLLLLWKYLVLPERNTLMIIALGIISGLIVVCRPTNAIFIPAAILFVGSLKKEAWPKFFDLKFIFISALFSFLIISIQLVYWKYLSGNWLYYSYSEEGFTYWKDPKLLEILFAPKNGLFLNSPAYLLIIIGFVVLFKHSVRKGLIFSFLFILVSYICGSWHAFLFGCSFGNRNFVEYTAFFSFPLAFLFDYSRKKRVKPIIKYLSLLIVIVGLKLQLSYDKCFFDKTWDYKKYKEFLTNGFYVGRKSISDDGIIYPSQQYTDAVEASLFFPFSGYTKAIVTSNVELFNDSTEAALIVDIREDGEFIYWNSVKIADMLRASGKRGKVISEFYIHQELSRDAKIRAYVWNIGQDSLRVRNINMYLK